jgi:arginine decarboxylase
MIPKKLFFTIGSGDHRTELGSFEMALRSAGVEKQNFVLVSSIIPPGCEILSFEEGVELLRPGEITFCVMARNSSSQEGEYISAALSYVIPQDPTKNGYIFEYQGDEDDPKEAERSAIELAEDLCKGIYDCEIEIGSVGISSPVKKWTTVLAVAIFLI